ncbi:kinase-like protein, partial [Zopfia rhizophila CBS 207.26]
MNNTHDFIQIREGVDLEISSRNFLPYRQIERLGQGCSASVDKVEDTTTGQVFAHKLFRRYDGRNIPKFKKIIHNEVSIIRRLSSHPHIIRLFATYTCGREFGMILTPVADSGDLANYLQTISDSGNPPTAEQFTTLQRAFGCLASSLAFIHRRTIRHKDIKPQNILIHQGCVIYTDFGIALDASESTTTTGRPEAFTRRYCSPEVANWDKRNRKSDVFSLGCVFLEILAVLEPHLDLENSREVAYYEIINDLRSALNHKRTVSSHWSELVRVCVIMLEPNPGRRISADDLLNEL